MNEPHEHDDPACPAGQACAQFCKVNQYGIDGNGRLLHMTYTGPWVVVTHPNQGSTHHPLETSVMYVGDASLLMAVAGKTIDEICDTVRWVQAHGQHDPRGTHDSVVSAVRAGFIDLSTRAQEVTWGVEP